MGITLRGTPLDRTQSYILEIEAMVKAEEAEIAELRRQHQDTTEKEAQFVILQNTLRRMHEDLAYVQKEAVAAYRR